MLRAYKYRLLPTEEQKTTLCQWLGASRYIYNLALEVKTSAWASAQKNVTCFDLINQLTDLRKEYDWIAAVPRSSLEQQVVNLDKAYTAFFKGAGFPKFKKRSNAQSIYFRQGLSIKEASVKIPKLGLVSFIQHRPIGEGELRSFTVSKTPAGSYFVSILVKDDKELPAKKRIRDKTTVGIDLGIKTFATLSDGNSFENPRYLHHSLKRLRIEQRKLNRRHKKGVKTDGQSKGWHKQRLVVAKLHEKIKNQRQDFLHKVSDSITKNFDTICLENLNVSGMIKNGKLAKAISDVGWYQFAQFLQYKCEWRGKNLIYIGRFDPSSKICSSCGNIFKELKLEHREWTCEKCGTPHERDYNAAINIKNFGSKTRPSTVKTSR